MEEFVKKVCTFAHVFKVFVVGTRKRTHLVYRCEHCGAEKN